MDDPWSEGLGEGLAAIQRCNQHSAYLHELILTSFVDAGEDFHPSESWLMTRAERVLEASAKKRVDPFHGEESELGGGKGDWPSMVGWRLTAKTSLPMTSNCDIYRRRLVSRRPIPITRWAILYTSSTLVRKLLRVRSLDGTSSAVGAF
jgi:hypothetical protein